MVFNTCESINILTRRRVRDHRRERAVKRSHTAQPRIRDSTISPPASPAARRVCMAGDAGARRERLGMGADQAQAVLPRSVAGRHAGDDERKREDDAPAPFLPNHLAQRCRPTLADAVRAICRWDAAVRRSRNCLVLWHGRRCWCGRRNRTGCCRRRRDLGRGGWGNAALLLRHIGHIAQGGCAVLQE